LNNVGKLQYRAGAAFRVETGVSGLALDRDCKAAHALARSLELAVQSQGRLQHQDSLRDAGQPPDVAGGIAAADLLIGIDKDQRAQRRIHVQCVQNFERVEHLHKAGFHVI
jgi:hypothetical protein